MQIVNDLVAVITPTLLWTESSTSATTEISPNACAELARGPAQGGNAADEPALAPTRDRRGRQSPIWVAPTNGKGRRARAAWATAFKRLADEGRYGCETPALAAEHFQSLVLTTPLNHAHVQRRDDRPPGAAQIKRYADRAVDVFLAAYGSA